MAPAFVARANEQLAGYLRAHSRLNWLVDLVRAVIREQGTQRIGLSAAGMAFWFVIAIFPALIATLMVLGLVLDAQQLSAAVAELEKASPDSMNGVVLKQVLNATEQQPSTLSIAFVVSLVVAIWSTSAGYYNFSRGARLAYGLPPAPYLVARTRAFVGAAVGLLITAGAVVGAALALGYASRQSGAWGFVVSAAVAVTVLVVLVVLLVGLFRFSTGRQSPTPKYLPGAVLGAVGTVAIAIGFSIYVSYAGNYEVVYGALAGGIILMLGVYLSAYAVLIGAVLNAQWRTASS
ncbi:MAG: YihY/virulence factor BrkB family protein [Actinomycetota bacterium]